MNPTGEGWKGIARLHDEGKCIGPTHAHKEWPIRERSANGEPKPKTSIERTCRRCGASFIGLAAGRTGEQGVWSSVGEWFCSRECESGQPPGKH